MGSKSFFCILAKGKYSNKKPSVKRAFCMKNVTTARTG